MSDAYYHSVSSAKAYGGDPESYLPIHLWMDRGRTQTHSNYHRIASHHTLGVADCIAHFGPLITNSRGRKVSTRLIAEQHIIEDVGFLPTFDEAIMMCRRNPFKLVGVRAKLLFSKINQFGGGDE